MMESNFWDHETVAQTHITWMADPDVRMHMNRLIGSEEAPRWPLEWFRDALQGRRFRRALSIGCGAGALERSLIDIDLVERIDAFDASVVALTVARRAAIESGHASRIHYYAADFNAPSLPRHHYDVVFIHQAAHHVAKLEKLYRAVMGALTPDGLLYLDEYVGPSRGDWSLARLAPHREEYARLPEELRLWPVDPMPLPIQWDDLTEAVRSREIEPQLRVGYDVVARRPYGGSLLAIVLPLLRLERTPREVIQRLIAREREWLARGEPSYYAVVVARPKRGLRALVAQLRYTLEPKLKRVAREVRGRLVRVPRSS